MNTPRTDAHSDKMDNEDFDVELAKTYDLARQLETELNLALWHLAIARKEYSEARRIEREGLIEP